MGKIEVTKMLGNIVCDRIPPKIDDVLQSLKIAKKNGATHITIQAGSIVFFVTRFETDDEMQERLQDERRKQERIRQRELEQLKILKLKYEHQDN